MDPAAAGTHRGNAAPHFSGKCAGAQNVEGRVWLARSHPSVKNELHSREPLLWDVAGACATQEHRRTDGFGSPSHHGNKAVFWWPFPVASIDTGASSSMSTTYFHNMQTYFHERHTQYTTQSRYSFGQMGILRNWTTFHKHLNRRRYAHKC